jgi:hypothetical protein
MSAAINTRPTIPAVARDFVPREFLGMARAFRSRVDTGVSTETQKIITSIIDPLRKRLRSKGGSPVFRPTSLIDAERRWQTELPAFARLSLQIERTKSGLSIIETRLSSGDVRFAGWVEGSKELDIGIQQIRVIARTGFFSIEATMLASVSIHSRARFYQRSFKNSDSALRNALREIVRNHAAAMASPPPGKFSIAAGDGRWLGSAETTRIDGKAIKLLCVRSFVGGDSPADAVTFGG